MVLLNLSREPLLKTVPEDCKSRLVALPVVYSSSQTPNCFQNQMRQEHSHSQGSIQPPSAWLTDQETALHSVPFQPPPQLCSVQTPVAQRERLSTMDRDCQRQKSRCCCRGRCLLMGSGSHNQIHAGFHGTELQIRHFRSAPFITLSGF